MDEAETLARKYNLIPEFKRMDATDMNCNPKYDVVSAVLFLHEVDPLYLPYILRNMLNALNDTGKLVISDFEGPYEQESGVVIWSAENIKYLLRNMGIDDAMMKFENIKADTFPNELGFYRCYVNKMTIDNEKLDELMQGYGAFLAKKKEDSEKMRDELRSQTKKRVCEILGRDNVDNKNMSDKEKKLLEKEIEPEYGIKTLKARLFTSQIEFLDKKIKELTSGARQS